MPIDKINIAIRKAVPEDAALLADLGRETFIETFGQLYAAEDLTDFLTKNFSPAIQAAEIAAANHHLAIAYLDDVAVGYAKSGPNKLPVPNPAAPAYELHRIYLKPRAKGAGVGKALMQDALQFFAKQNAAGIYLGVWAENIRAQSFYAGFGFRVIAEYDFMVGNQADHELIMQRDPQGL